MSDTESILSAARQCGAHLLSFIWPVFSLGISFLSYLTPADKKEEEDDDNQPNTTATKKKSSKRSTRREIRRVWVFIYTHTHTHTHTHIYIYIYIYILFCNICFSFWLAFVIHLCSLSLSIYSSFFCFILKKRVCKCVSVCVAVCVLFVGYISRLRSIGLIGISHCACPREKRLPKRFNRSI